ncbi:MAG: hypothetical protein QOH12_3114 [Solirubrobacteraceae bacterium]|jgi:hypothetical protein|nr:hypothetical protein [Solirubrobacteraceae bacterium]
MRRFRWVPALGLIFLGLSLSSPASASPSVPLRLVYAHAFSAVMTDGVRYAAFEPTAGTTRLIDATTGAVVDRPDPAGCAGGLVGVGSNELLYSCSPPGCVPPVLGPVSGGLVMFACATAPTPPYARVLYVVEDIAGGALHVAVGSDRILAGGGGEYPAFDRIGSQWLSSPFVGNHVYVRLYLNWHTGQQMTDNTEPRSSAGSAEDLDAPKLLKALCAPLRRTAQADDVDTTSAFFPFAYSGPFGASLTTGRLQLRRCGSARVAQLPGAGVTQFQLSGGAIAWATFSRQSPYQPSLDRPGAIYAAALHSTGRRWLATPYRYVGAPAGVVAHTAAALYDSTASLGGLYSQIYTARLRR